MDKRLIYGGLAVLGVLAFFAFRKKAEILAHQGLVQANNPTPLPTTTIPAPQKPAGPPPAMRRPQSRDTKRIDKPVAPKTQPQATASAQAQGPAQVTLSPTMFYRPPV